MTNRKSNRWGCIPCEDVCLAHGEPLEYPHGCYLAAPHRCKFMESSSYEPTDAKIQHLADSGDTPAPATEGTPDDAEAVIVCDACGEERCWAGEFMCEDSQHAGTKTIYRKCTPAARNRGRGRMKDGDIQINQLPLPQVWQMILDTLSLVPSDAEFTHKQFFNKWLIERYPEHHSPWGLYLPLLEVLTRPGGPLQRRRPENGRVWKYSFRTQHPEPDEWYDCTIARCPYNQFMKKMGWKK